MNFEYGEASYISIHINNVDIGKSTFDEQFVKYAFGELDEVALCYATTIYKQQGWKYPVVVIPSLCSIT